MSGTSADKPNGSEGFWSLFVLIVFIAGSYYFTTHELIQRVTALEQRVQKIEQVNHAE